MGIAEQESKAFEREVKFQIEEKERRESEQHTMDLLEVSYAHRTELWRKQKQDSEEVCNIFDFRE